MSTQIGTYEIGLDTPIHLLTPRQLFELMDEWTAKSEPLRQAQPMGTTDRWHVTSMADLAEILGTSKSTAYKMKADGLIDEAVSQCGRWMCIDVNKVLEIFRLSNRRGKRKQQGAASPVRRQT